MFLIEEKAKKPTSRRANFLHAQQYRRFSGAIGSKNGFKSHVPVAVAPLKSDQNRRVFFHAFSNSPFISVPGARLFFAYFFQFFLISPSNPIKIDEQILHFSAYFLFFFRFLPKAPFYGS